MASPSGFSRLSGVGNRAGTTAYFILDSPNDQNYTDDDRVGRENSDNRQTTYRRLGNHPEAKD
jgi:hypothetical protein